MLQGLSSGGLKLSGPVGPGAVNNPDDVFRVELDPEDRGRFDKLIGPGG